MFLGVSFFFVRRTEKMNIIQPSNANNTRLRFAQGVRADGLFGAFSQIPDLMNGDAAGLTPIYLSPGIPDMWKWVVPNLTAVATATDLMNAVLEVATIMVRRADDPNDQVTQMSCLLVALARVSVTRAWNLTGADLETTQKVTVAPNALASGHTNLVPAYAEPGPGAATDKDATYSALAALVTDEVRAFMTNLVKMAIGLPAAVGCSLVASNGHHFVPTTAVIFRAISRQVFQTTTLTAPLMDATTTEDAIYHKAMHPIKSGVLVWIARNAACKQRITSSGLGSAAVRMPALYPTEKSAGAILAIVRKAIAASTEHNVNGDVSVIELAAEDVRIDTDSPITASVLSDSQDALARLEQSYGEHVAWCAGYLTAMMENTNVRGGTSTVLRAYSVKRIITDNEASFASGSQWYSIATRWRRQVITNGDLPGVGLFGAAAPASQPGSGSN
jgi:hypothetical protein